MQDLKGFLAAFLKLFSLSPELPTNLDTSYLALLKSPRIVPPKKELKIFWDRSTCNLFSDIFSLSKTDMDNTSKSVEKDPPEDWQIESSVMEHANWNIAHPVIIVYGAPRLKNCPHLSKIENCHDRQSVQLWVVKRSGRMFGFSRSDSKNFSFFLLKRQKRILKELSSTTVDIIEVESLGLKGLAN